MAFPLDDTDQLFARFCRHGDAAALGAVFDATATELLRIACHLAGNRADAEDLVQRTFLAAIESRASYEPQRRALPWLIGILANHARRLRREIRSRPAMATATALDPATSAAERELAERLAALRDDLGEPYGEVLRLHLEQGLNAKEIASSLQRPAGTVRTQLVRALAQLRHRLPDGFLAGIVPFAANAPDVAPGAMAAMRDTVLRSALGVPAVTGAVPLAVTGGWFVGKKLALVVSLLVAVLSLVVHFAAQPPASAPPLPEVAAAERTSAGSGALLASSDGALAGERTPVAAPIPSSSGEPGFAVVRVRVRWRGDGGPAAGVGVFATNGSDVARRDAVTDARGDGELPHLRPGPWSIGNALGEQAAEVVLHAGQVTTLELFADRRATVRGRVVDAGGTVVADARIWMSTGVDLSHGHEVARSDAAGEFVVPILARHRIGARKAGYSPSHCFAVDVAEPGSLTLELRLEHRGGSVAGVVRDRNGAVIPWAKVLFGEEHRSPSPIADRGEFLPRGVEVATDAHGAFAVDGVPAGICEVRAWAPGHAPFQGSIEVPAAGRAETSITLAPGAVVSGTVRDPKGAPVPGAVLRWGNAYGFASRTAVTGATGEYALDDLPEGAARLEAERGTARRATIVTTIAGGTATWDPVLAVGLPIGGRVLGPRDEPLPGLVVMGQNGGDPFHAVTDAQGGFLLPDAGSDPVALEVADEQSLLQLANVAPGTVDLVLRIGEDRLPSAFLRGRLVDERGRPVAAQLGPAHEDSLRVRFYASDPQTGAFDIGPLRPGAYRLDGESPTLGTRLLARPRLAPGATIDLGDVVFSTPGTVVITVTAGGRSVAAGDVVFRRVEERWYGRTAIELGQARHAALPPGRYYVSASAVGLAGSGEIEVGAGSVVPMAIELQPTVRAIVTVHDPRGVAIDTLDPTITAWTADGRFAATFRGPSNDVVPRFVADLPAGRYGVTVVATDGRTTKVSLDLSSAADLTIELPR